jgi:hypothetical protein
VADQPKGRDTTRSPGQDMSSPQADVPVRVARHRDVMLIERLVAAGKRVARVAGGLYLLIVVLRGIAHLAVRAGLRVPG